MKKFYFFLYLLLLGYPCSSKNANIPRKVFTMNREWKYVRQDIPDAQLVNFNDSQWENVGIPHSFSIPYFLSKEFYVGYGWYRKKFTLEKTDCKKYYFIEFDGVF